LSWPGMSRPSASCSRVSEFVDARDKRGHDEGKSNGPVA
jgi:hypothetical protein